MTREDLLALRATFLAAVAQCDAALARVEAAPVSPAACTCYICASGERCSKAAALVAEDCTHPTVISTAVSGNPDRKKCTKCGETVYPVPA